MSRPQTWRPAPWREATRTFSAPLAVVDVDRFDANAADLLARAGGLPVRLASKSVRVRHLIHRALDLGFSGVMAYSLAEALWLAEDGIEDVLLAYPSVDTAALVRLASTPALREKITLMVDDVSQVALVERAFIRAGSPAGPPVNVCLDIDASLRLGVGGAHVHLGVRRSPVRTGEDAVALARSVQRTGTMRLRGVMFYEAQVAGMPETGLKAPVIRLIKGLTMLELAGRRPSVVTALEEHLGRPMLVNGGGTGSVQRPHDHRDHRRVRAVLSHPVRLLRRLHRPPGSVLRAGRGAPPRPRHRHRLRWRLRSLRTRPPFPAAPAGGRRPAGLGRRRRGGADPTALPPRTGRWCDRVPGLAAARQSG